MLQGNNQLTSYAEIAKYFSKCRSPVQGRPLRHGVRLYREGDSYVVKTYRCSDRTPILKVLPNNTVTFLAPLEYIIQHPYSMTRALYSVVPFYMQRVNKGIYRVACSAAMPLKYSTWGTHPDWEYMRSQAPQYFNGIKFDFHTGRCINPQPDQLTVEIPRRRKVWRRDLRRYKRGLKARIKVGALRGFVDYAYSRTVWTDEKWTDLLVRSMKTDTYPQDILRAFARSPADLDPDDNSMLKAVDRVFTAHSEHFRQKYGVFGKPLHVKS